MNMQQIRLENNGLTFIIEGTWCEISGPEGVVRSGSVSTEGLTEDEIRDTADKLFHEFILRHTVVDCDDDYDDGFLFKAVAWSESRKDFIQLQAMKPDEAGYYIIQEYNSDLVFLREHVTYAWYRDDANAIMKKKYNLQKGLLVWVYKRNMGDCSNGGVSADDTELYIVQGSSGVFQLKDVRQCLTLVHRNIRGSEYVNAKPVFHPNRHYMAGGNFVYSSDSRYKEITGVSYPVSIHDRYEGR